MRLDVAGLALQRPVAAQAGRAGGVGRGGHVGMAQFRQAPDKGGAATAGADVAAIQQNIAAWPEGRAQRGQFRLAALQIIGGERRAAQHQVGRLAVRHDVHGRIAVVLRRPLRHLRQAILAAIEHDDVRALRQLARQALVVGDIGHDEHHLPGRRRRPGSGMAFLGPFAGGRFHRAFGRRMGHVGMLRRQRAVHGSAIEHQPRLQRLQQQPRTLSRRRHARLFP